MADTITDRWCCDVCSTTVSFDYLSVREASNYIGRHVDDCHPTSLTDRLLGWRFALLFGIGFWAVVIVMAVKFG